MQQEDVIFLVRLALFIGYSNVIYFIGKSHIEKSKGWGDKPPMYYANGGKYAPLLKRVSMYISWYLKG